MSRVIVSIVSEQTIPNYIFIRSMYKDGDSLMFITSNNDSFKKKERSIIDTLSLSSEVISIHLENIGDEENWTVMSDAIKPFLSEDIEYIVNLTGGTKYMALSVEMIFSNYNSSFYYIPFPKNIILQLNTQNIISISYKVNIKEYMSLYGLPIRTGSLIHPYEQAKDFFQIFKELTPKEHLILDKLRSYRDTKPIDILMLETKEDTEKKPRIEGLSNFLKFISYPKTTGKIDKYDIRYITGGWFEEYVYYIIQELISPNDIQIGVLIEESLSTNMNDLDVVFTLGNKLFVIECKTGVGGRSLFSQIVYKASALKETLFGLSGKSYIFSLSPEVENLKIVAKNMGVTYCDETYFNQHEKIEDLITSMKLYAKN